MSLRRYYNKHLLYVTCDQAHKHQIENIVSECMEKISKTLGREVRTEFEVNLVTNREGGYLGFCYIWLNNPEVYHILTGRNADGTERIEYREMEKVSSEAKTQSKDNVCQKDVKDVKDTKEDKDVKDTKDTKDLKISPKSEKAKELSKPSWADACEEDKLRVELPPLIEIPQFKHDDEQFLNTKKEYGTICIKPAFVTEVAEKYSHNVLCARDVSEKVTVEMLKEIFLKFTSDSKTKVKKRTGKNSFVLDTYPIISINGKRTAFVVFDPRTRDAQFALLMKKKIFQEGLSSPILFNYSYKTK